MNNDVISNFVIILVPLTISFALIMKKDSSIERKIALISYLIAVVSFIFFFLYYDNVGALRTINDVLKLVVAPTLLIFIVSFLYPMYRILRYSKSE